MGCGERDLQRREGAFRDVRVEDGELRRLLREHLEIPLRTYGVARSAIDHPGMKEDEGIAAAGTEGLLDGRLRVGDVARLELWITRSDQNARDARIREITTVSGGRAALDPALTAAARLSASPQSIH